MNVLSRIVGMKKLCVVLGGLGLLSTGAWAQDGGYSGQVDEGGAYGQSPSYGAEGVSSGEQGTPQAPGSWDGANTADQVHSDAGTGMKQDRGPIQNPSAAPKDGVQFALGVGLGTGPRYLGSDGNQPVGHLLGAVRTFLPGFDARAGRRVQYALRTAHDCGTVL